MNGAVTTNYGVEVLFLLKANANDSEGYGVIKKNVNSNDGDNVRFTPSNIKSGREKTHNSDSW